MRPIGKICLGMLICLAFPAQAVEKIVVAVGNNLGLEGEEPLRFAEKDAQRIADVFVDLGGADRQRVYLLQGKKPGDLEAALTEGRGRAAELGKQGREVWLIFYYAGHGDSQSLNMGSHKLERSQLDEWLKQVPAQLKLAIIDSCQTSGASRGRGVTMGKPFDIQLSTRPNTGSVLITSASPGEPAQESDELGGAVFSHYLLSGLRGPADANSDRQVTLQEAYAFAYTRTLLRTAGNRAGVQHPVFDYDIEGSGPLVLTQTMHASARLIFPAETDVRYLVYRLPGRNILAEVPSQSDRQSVLALPAGRFLVQRREPGRYGVCEIDLPWGGQENIQPKDFTHMDYQRLALRGGRMSIRNWLLSAAYRTEVVPSTDMSFGHGGEIAAGYTLGSVLFDLKASFIYAPIDYPRYEGSEYRLGLRPSVNYLMVKERYTVRLGLGLSIRPVWQHLIDRDADRLKAAGMDYEEHHQSTGLGPQLIAGFSASIMAFTALQLEVSYSPLWIHGLNEDETQVDLRHSLGLSLGVSRTF